MQSVGRYQEVLNRITRNKIDQTEIMGELLILCDTMIKDMVMIESRIAKISQYQITSQTSIKPKLSVVEKEDFVPDLDDFAEVKQKALKALKAKEVKDNVKPIRAKDYEAPGKTGPKTGHQYTPKQKAAMKRKRNANSEASETRRKQIKGDVIIAKSKT